MMRRCARLHEHHDRHDDDDADHQRNDEQRRQGAGTAELEGLRSWRRAGADAGEDDQ